MPRTKFEHDFLSALGPLLRAADTAAALDALIAYPPCILVNLLNPTDAELLAVAIEALRMTGSIAECDPIVPFLAHQDPAIAAAAENALWSIWMRAGSAAGNRRLARAMRQIQADQHYQARQSLMDLTVDEPQFAEAHHQLGLVLSLIERGDDALLSLRRALRLNPLHFAAASGIGHIHAMRGELADALRNYRRSLQIHPNQPDLREVLPQLEAAVRRSAVA
ncbi:MAG: hypothetical protein U1D55_04720 [Phycisphaerae bacterium]